MNWGKGITICIILFMGFILSMVFKANQTDADLYAADYYAQELSYQLKIDAKQNANNLKGALDIRQDSKSVIIEFPDDCLGKILDGSIHFYRPDNAALDKHFPIQLVGAIQKFWKGALIQGHYLINISWKMNGQHYLIEKPINIQ